jgi:hypothetical protein
MKRLLTTLLLLFALTAHASDWPAWTPEQRLVLVQAIAAENSGHRLDAAAQEIPDPCPKAKHFGGDLDVWRMKGKEPVCGPPAFANTFWE